MADRGVAGEVDLLTFLKDRAVIFISTGILAIGIIIWVFMMRGSKKKEEEKEIPPPKSKEKETTSKPAKQKPATQKKEDQESGLRLTSLKGFKDEVLAIDVSSDGEFIAAASRDRSLKLYDAHKIYDKIPQFIHINLPLDYASALTFSTDSRHIILALGNSRDILAYKISSKKLADGKTYKEVARFPTKHEDTIKSISISTNSKFILTSSEDTMMYLWNLKGVLLETINSNQMKHNMAAISPDSRFFSVATWTGDVKLWEVLYNKESGDFEKTARAFELKGHKSTVYCLNFSADASKVATTSKDGTWRLWRITIRFQIGEDPHCLVTVPCPPSASSGFNLISISPDSQTVAVTSFSNYLFFYNISGSLLDSTPTGYNGPIHSLVWLSDSSAVLTAGDAAVTVWKNPNK